MVLEGLEIAPLPSVHLPDPEIRLWKPPIWPQMAT
jgi:hypothetical protein